LGIAGTHPVPRIQPSPFLETNRVAPYQEKVALKICENRVNVSFPTKQFFVISLQDGNSECLIGLLRAAIWRA
jgi:hypothetical protein